MGESGREGAAPPGVALAAIVGAEVGAGGTATGAHAATSTTSAVTTTKRPAETTATLPSTILV
jgi:hypothetical protein